MVFTPFSTQQQRPALLSMGAARATSAVTLLAVPAGFAAIPAANAATPLAVTFTAAPDERYLVAWLVRVLDVPRAAQQVYIAINGVIQAGGLATNDYTYNGVTILSGLGGQQTVTLQTYYYGTQDRGVSGERYVQVYRLR